MLRILEAKKKKIPPRCTENNLKVGPAPPAITNLNIVETRLTCQIYPFMNIIEI